MFLILFKSSSGNFNEDILCLVFAFVAFAATSASVTGSLAPFGSVAGSSVGVLFKFFIGNNLVLKLALNNNNPKLFLKSFCSIVFIPLPKFFNSLAKLLCLLSAFSVDKSSSCISLKKQEAVNVY